MRKGDEKEAQEKPEEAKQKEVMYLFFDSSCLFLVS